MRLKYVNHTFEYKDDYHLSANVLHFPHIQLVSAKISVFSGRVVKIRIGSR